MTAENGISTRARRLWPLLPLAAAALAPAAAQPPDCGATAEIALICRQAPDGRKASLVRTELPARGGCERPLLETFTDRDRDRPRSLALAVGQSGECRFADGGSLRVRVQAGPPPPAGPCSGQPSANFSLWLDDRRVADRREVRSRCESAPTPWTYRVDGDAVYDCSNGDCGPLLAPEQTLAALPVDAGEFPDAAAAAAAQAAAQAAAAPNGLQRLLDRGPVCAEAERQLALSWDAFDPFRRGDDGDAPLHRVAASEAPAGTAMPDALAFVHGAWRAFDFDFDNDGLIDRVYLGDARDEGEWYASPLLVVAGASAQQFQARAGAAAQALPCQWDGARPPLSHCDDLRSPAWSRREPLQQAVPAPLPGLPGGDAFFQTRTATALPLRYEDATYVALRSSAGPARDYVALYRPKPGGGREAVCLIQRRPDAR
ncbi:hypothetical protein [Lysobacter enzymogenes]|uniref:Uncharacterized protein n=1 Tax=Lysobacter enzymogenes TaxID=69 RepID=A0A3N2RK73_LYSEN|nr:hypothetical protein [Lysobacter enzymogenes]ROU07875.1 hypothetical protein D9T17_06645 [Lysobacter enzymogenes]